MTSDRKYEYQKYIKTRKKYYENNKHIWKNCCLKRDYGITLGIFNDMLIDQNYRCKICSVHFNVVGSSKTHVDHCHKTGKIRGLLCGGCNLALGYLHDDVDTLKAAIKYLEAN